MTNWKYIKQNVSMENICEFEALVGAKLPESTAQFLIQYNNGRPVKKCVNTREGVARVFDKILSFNKNDIENAFITYENFRDEIPSNLLPIAMDPFGNYFCLDKNNEFHIVFWDVENNKIENTGESLVDLVEHFH